MRVVEGDLGGSGCSSFGRDDFDWLVCEVTLDHVGLVAGFQINHLACEDEAILAMKASSQGKCRVLDGSRQSSGPPGWKAIADRGEFC
jgi:hypothetical protein